MKKIIFISIFLLLSSVNYSISQADETSEMCMSDFLKSTSTENISKTLEEGNMLLGSSVEASKNFEACTSINPRFFEITPDYSHYTFNYFNTETYMNIVVHDGEIVYRYYTDPDASYHPFVTPYLSSDGNNVLIWNRLSDNDTTGEYFRAVQDALGVYINGTKVFSPNYEEHRAIGSDLEDFYDMTGLREYFQGENNDYSFYIDDSLSKTIDSKLADIENEIGTEILYDRIASMREGFVDGYNENTLSRREYIQFLILDYMHATHVIENFESI